MEIKLRYVGNGAFVPPYPARDLNAEEVEQYGQEALLATGLYEKESPSIKKEKKESKA
jgi:hypothetical protein